MVWFTSEGPIRVWGASATVGLDNMMSVMEPFMSTPSATSQHGTLRRTTPPRFQQRRRLRRRIFLWDREGGQRFSFTHGDCRDVSRRGWTGSIRKRRGRRASISTSDDARTPRSRLDTSLTAYRIAWIIRVYFLLLLLQSSSTCH